MVEGVLFTEQDSEEAEILQLIEVCLLYTSSGVHQAGSQVKLAS